MTQILWASSPFKQIRNESVLPIPLLPQLPRKVTFWVLRRRICPQLQTRHPLTDGIDKAMTHPEQKGRLLLHFSTSLSLDIGSLTLHR